MLRISQDYVTNNVNNNSIICIHRAMTSLVPRLAVNTVVVSTTNLRDIFFTVQVVSVKDTMKLEKKIFVKFYSKKISKLTFGILDTCQISTSRIVDRLYVCCVEDL